MICDRVNLTFPESVSTGLLSDIGLVLNAAGATSATDSLWRHCDGGTVFLEHKRGFTVMQVSGALLGTLRKCGLYDDFFLPFVGVPHRITRLDIAHDVARDSPALLKRLYSKARSGSVGLTRKKLRGHQIRKLFSPGLDGRDTGTVYLGSPTAEVKARIYDKAFERYCKAGIEPIGPLTRYELTITNKGGASLSDVFSPSAAFWHYMGDVLRRPANAPDWSPSDSGFDLPKRSSLLPYEILSRKVADSAEIGNLLSLASDCGPMGLETLIRKIRERHSRDHGGECLAG